MSWRLRKWYCRELNINSQTSIQQTDAGYAASYRRSKWRQWTQWFVSGNTGSNVLRPVITQRHFFGGSRTLTSTLRSTVRRNIQRCIGISFSQRNWDNDERKVKFCRIEKKIKYLGRVIGFWKIYLELWDWVFQEKHPTYSWRYLVVYKHNLQNANNHTTTQKIPQQQSSSPCGRSEESQMLKRWRRGHQQGEFPFEPIHQRHHKRHTTQFHSHSNSLSAERLQNSKSDKCRPPICSHD